MSIETTLENVGLDKHEAVVYLALVEKNDSSVSDIVRGTKLHRPQVYESLTLLEGKGLAQTVIKGKRKRYVAASPQKLETMFSEREVVFYKNVDQLHEMYQAARANRPSVTFSEGKDAVKNAHMDIPKTLGRDELYLRYMPVETFLRKKYIPKGYRELCDKKGLERKIITSSQTKKGSNKLTRSVRAIPREHDLFKYNVGLTIYGNKVSLVDYESESVIVVEHKKFTEFQRKVFELLFSKLPKPE